MVASSERRVRGAVGERRRRLRTSRPPTAGDPQWYKDAVIYEVHVRAFRDSNADGIGDFRGLTEKLDYLRDLGITAIWVLPFYPSPLKDDGYDIADYTNVHPDYGTLADVRLFIREAHRRGLRVITELVCNHTSDQHPWFQRARRAAPGSPYRDFYVWSDTPDRYPEARIIFKDFETSNWTWDPVAGAYFWHRFYSHQPDLNFDNPRVREAMFKITDFWLDMGVDGLRLDAVPYLYEREGTDCENLPETHAFLRELRAHVDAKYGDRMLLAEANQWPEDSVAYFGDGDECHMAFHFPLMPRMFMSIRMEDRFPIIDILEQTPPIPPTAQWALFLRNHDELTLEMVTDEERDYMYRVYAHDPQMRINLGIRRRLAPLLGNHRRRVELLNGLLFSLPGTPVVYYGDEIGMGDNVYVRDRNGVRTPMQWSGDRNAGFSEANRQQLYLPVIADPEYHPEAVNVEVQQANPHSLLWWTKRLIDLRKRHPAFSRGDLSFIQPDNRRILAFTRRHDGEIILVVTNLSRFVQYAELDLSEFEGRVPTEMFGRVEFPPIGDAPYFLSLGPHEFLWFSLEVPTTDDLAVATAPEDLPLLPLVETIGALLDGGDAADGSRVIVRWMRSRRWFRGKSRRIKGAKLVDSLPIRVGAGDAAILLLEVDYVEGDPETYIVPLAILPPSDGVALLGDAPAAGLARLRSGGSKVDEGYLVDATAIEEFSIALVEAVAARRRLRGGRGELVARPEASFRKIVGGAPLRPEPIRAEQSNSSVILDERAILKVYRTVGAGTNPDLEVSRFLAERGFEHAPATAGWIEYRPARGAPGTVAILQAFVPNQGDVFEFTLDELRGYFERVLTIPTPPDVGDLGAAALLEASRGDIPPLASETIGAYLETANLLGVRTGDLHRALADAPDNPDFAPEPFSELYQRSVYQAIQATARRSLRQLERIEPNLPEPVASDARAVLLLADRVDRRLRDLFARKLDGQRIRVHGDFHAGQILHTGRDLLIIDFEGEPTRPLSERRLKRSALVDVAGMLRSFHYAAFGSLLRPELGAQIRPEDVAALEPWAAFWYRWVSVAYLTGYDAATRGAKFLPSNDADRAILIDAFLLHKAAYELDYELNNRPDWVAIPLRGILELLS
jgi:maltose alpha-D-glucosyltransferase/alpha-amylase